MSRRVAQPRQLTQLRTPTASPHSCRFSESPGATAAEFILASASPRRIELLQRAGFDFRVAPPTVAERNDDSLTARELTGWNAVRKGLAVARRRADSIILAADTVVCLEGKIIGKPADLACAAEILRLLSGRTHHVYSSVFIVDLAANKSSLFGEVSQVRFRKLDTEAIRDYLTKIDPLDKAGAYAAQGHGAEIIARIDGSYSNVVGLPMARTVVALRSYGIYPCDRSNSRSPSPGDQPGDGARLLSATRDKETKR